MLELSPSNYSSDFMIYSRELMQHANTLTGADAYCFKAFAEALEIIPYTLAENAGLNPIGKYLVIFNLSVVHSKTQLIMLKGSIHAYDSDKVISFQELIFKGNLEFEISILVKQLCCGH